MDTLSSKILSSSILKELKNGIPIGHKSINLSKRRFWHPLMTPFLLGIRNKIAIINPSATKKCVLRAFFIIALLFKSNGHLLIINTNPEYFILNKNLSLLTLQPEPISTLKHNVILHETPFHVTFDQKGTKTTSISIYKKYKALRTSKISYCSSKWVGGTLTNWKQISKSVLTFAKFSERCENFLLKNNIEFPRYNRIKTCFEGLIRKEHNKTILAFYEKPDLIFLVNPNENQNIILEANKLHIPIIAFTESNTNLKGITYPIPLNTYSMNFVYYCLKKLIKISLNSEKQRN